MKTLQVYITCFIRVNFTKHYLHTNFIDVMLGTRWKIVGSIPRVKGSKGQLHSYSEICLSRVNQDHVTKYSQLTSYFNYRKIRTCEQEISPRGVIKRYEGPWSQVGAQATNVVHKSHSCFISNVCSQCLLTPEQPNLWNYSASSRRYCHHRFLINRDTFLKSTAFCSFWSPLEFILKFCGLSSSQNQIWRVKAWLVFKIFILISMQTFTFQGVYNEYWICSTKRLDDVYAVVF